MQLISGLGRISLTAYAGIVMHLICRLGRISLTACAGIVTHVISTLGPISLTPLAGFLSCVLSPHWQQYPHPGERALDCFSFINRCAHSS